MYDLNIYTLRESKSASQGVTGKPIFLGGAAPLSSRKIGYLLRVAHMIPIIFSGSRTLTWAPPGTLLNGFTSFA